MSYGTQLFLTDLLLICVIAGTIVTVAIALAQKERGRTMTASEEPRKANLRRAV
jgi:hypothetical protein